MPKDIDLSKNTIQQSVSMLDKVLYERITGLLKENNSEDMNGFFAGICTYCLKTTKNLGISTSEVLIDRLIGQLKLTVKLLKQMKEDANNED